MEKENTSLGFRLKKYIKEEISFNIYQNKTLWIKSKAQKDF